MAAQKKGLGQQGFNVLDKFISSDTNDIDNNAKGKEKENLKIDMDMIKTDSDQPRNIFIDETINELAESIKSVGIISPIIVSKDGEFYKLIAGERRYRAAKIAGLKEIPAIISDVDELKRLEISLIENIQRENLNPVDESLVYKRFKDDFGLTDEQIAEKTGKSRSYITNSLRLIKLDQRVTEFLKKNLLTSGHARALLSIDDGDIQFEFAEKIIDEQLSVRQTEETIKEYNEETKAFVEKKSNIQSKADSEIYSDLSEKLKNILGTKVKIKNNNKNNKGKIEIEYYSPDELDRIICLFNKLNEE